MKSFILFILLSSHAWVDPFVESVTISSNFISSTTELVDLKSRVLLNFEPNVASGLGLAFESKYLNLAYVFTSGSTAEDPDFERSRYQDFRINFFWKQMDFRLNYQRYQGALVKENGLTEFYSDYRVQSLNGRVFYYTNEALLPLLREGFRLTSHVAKNEGLDFEYSWILGLNVDWRKIRLPEKLAPEHQARVDENGFIYDPHFNANSQGPIAGVDTFLQYNKNFLRGKLAFGTVYQSGGDWIFRVR